jgi:hypothetical protein
MAPYTPCPLIIIQSRGYVVQTDLELDIIPVLRSELLGLLKSFLLSRKRFGRNRFAVELSGYDVLITHCVPSGAGRRGSIFALTLSPPDRARSH